MSAPSVHISIAPTRGTRRFRRNARLEIRDGRFVATDRHGRSSSVALDGSPFAPCRAVTRPDRKGKRTELAILDGNGDAFVIAEHGDWDSFERIDLMDAAGIRMGSRLEADVPSLRDDGCVVLDSTWWRWSPIVGSGAFAVGMFSGGGVIPRGIGFSLVVVAFVYLMAAVASGAFGRERQGKAYKAENALMAGDPTAVRAYTSERRRRIQRRQASQADEPEDKRGRH